MVRYVCKNLIKKSQYNINLLIRNNKTEQTVYNIQSYLNNYDKITYSELYYVNKNIDKIYLSYSIKEGLDLLNKKNINTKKYENKFAHNFNNNIELYYLFKEIENNIKLEYKERKIYNILPFYYNIYLNKMK